MNEIFSFRRFMFLALKYYRENMRLAMIFLLAMVVITFLVLCHLNPFVIEYSWIDDTEEVPSFMQHYEQMYSQMFWSLSAVFAFIVALYSFRGFVVKEKVMNTLLLPASNLEKYVLALLNSTVVIFVVFLLLFYPLAEAANSYKYVGVNRLEYKGKGIFGNEIPAMSPGQIVVYPRVGNVFKLSPGENIMSITQGGKEIGFGTHTAAYDTNLALIVFFYILSVGMWGSITFRKHPLILNFLLHTTFILTLILLSVWVANRMFGEGPEVARDTLSFYGGEQLPPIPSKWWVLTMYLFPLAYQYVIWMKLKTKQIQ